MTRPTIQFGNSLDLLTRWDTPVVIVSDGPYGVSGYDGDLAKADGLADWYEPHIKAWSKQATPLTTLWFWNTEVGWAEVHPILKRHGWIYRSCNIWNKGISHVAGNTNTKTLRRFPVVTEVCAHYVRSPQFRLGGQSGLSAQDWLRAEWTRTGLPFCLANVACGVANAATRKYLTADHLWYFPPPEVFDKLVTYANEKGDPAGRPYFSVDGTNVLSKSQWEQLRGKFYCPAGVTNVWDHSAVRGSERIKVDGKAVHPNQKPLALMELIITSSSEKGDVIWEPFGGLCSASFAAAYLDRAAFAAEIEKATYDSAIKRFDPLWACI
jgi:site-specific DNA-methyltransferase (adenine-specific)